jgi:lysyl-tRNA synthetase class 2
MAETVALARALISAGGGAAAPVETLSYSAAFARELGCDPLSAPQAHLAALAEQHGLARTSIGSATRDDLLDFLVGTCVGPRLGRGTLACLHHFPASQAALAQLDAADPRTALRFELYGEGIELANGYVELAHASEQRARVAADLAQRRARGLTEPAIDERLLAALDAGLPACAGVAMGFDRVAMLALGAGHIDATLAFPWEIA